MMMNKKLFLNEGWKFSIASKNKSAKKIQVGKSYPALVPGTVHTDLLNNKLIEDPYFSDNEKRLRWISECDWVYETNFVYRKSDNENIDLVFEGLDTIAEIFLNEKKLAETENMFLEYRFDVTKKLLEGENHLKIIFFSPVKYVEELQDEYGELPVERNPERIYIRKAQYSYGWDWGPIFPTSGIWKNIYLEKINGTRISSFSFETISANSNKAKLEILIDIDKKKRGKYNLTCEIVGAGQTLTKEIKGIGNSERFNFTIKNPKLWFSAGEGEQYLYDLKLTLSNKDGSILDEKNKKVGIRTVELIEKDKGENAFKFLINGKDVFCKGANWIPADSFLPRITRKNYLKELRLAKDANMNMIRVWGGGIYESDEFYEECDRLGLMVWQDMMFACAAYPEHKSFIQNVKKEITQNVKRLQYHPSIVIWCGNNENEWIWYRWQKESYKKLPGLKIYESVIPKILDELDNTRPYWQSSPFGYDEDPNSEESGNRHQWDVWSVWKDYDEVIEDKSLFVTEFGFQGPANKKTFEKYLPEKNRKYNDEIFEFHNKQEEGPDRIFRFLSGHLPISTEWDEYLYLAQLNQGFALKTCLEHWRTNGLTMGSIIWQLNDSYPVTSWSLIDYELEQKLSYYFVKESFGEFLIYQKNENYKMEFYLLNQNQKKFNAEFRINILDGTTGLVVSESSKKIKVKDKLNSRIFTLPEHDLPREGAIVIATLVGEDKKIISQNYFITKRWKYLNLKRADIKIEKENENQISLTSETPLFFADLFHPDYSFNKRGFIILPGEKMVVTIAGNSEEIKTDEIKVTSLNDFLSK